ncbi:MAG: YkgJ family cysteine cluster protein [Planctomycetes bacterium]|nr:YkgJ family cysteine cluster protein [Planctomycetota bacterium]
MDVSAHPLIDHLKRVCKQANAEFDRGAAVHGERIHCAPGCSSCCSQIFQITEVEAARISAWVATLPHKVKLELREKARANLAARAKLFGGPEQWGSTVPRGKGTPCPALDDAGACGMYEARPIMCRKFGVPIYNPDKPDRVLACELNFADGEAIEDPGLVENQTSLYRAQQNLQAEYNDAGGKRDDKPICIARAIVEDFTGYLP